MPVRQTGAVLAALVLVAGAQAHATVFDYSALAPTSAATPLAITADGVTATFASPSDGGAFTAEDGAGFTTLGAAVLANNNFAAEELDIAFSSGLLSIRFAFATADTGAATGLSLTAFLHGVQVGSADVSGALAASGFPEGVLSFDGAAFDSVSITDSNAPGFAIGALDVRVPEPATAALLGAGLLGLAGARRRGLKEI